MAKAKESTLSVEIQIISLKNVQNYQDIKIKKRLLEDLGVIATKMKRRQMTKSDLWLKLQMRLDNQFIERDHLIGIGFPLDIVEFISFTFGDKEMIPMLYLRGSAMKLCRIWTKILLCWTCAQKLKLCRGKLIGFRVSIADLFLKRRNRSTMSKPCLSLVGNEYSEKGQKQSKTDKTKHGMVKHEKVKVKVNPKVKVKVKDEAESEEILNGPTQNSNILRRFTRNIRKLLEDVQNISEELAEYINSPSWNRPAFYFDDDDDEESSIPVRDIISKLPLCVAITPRLTDDDNSHYGGRQLSNYTRNRIRRINKV
ncbi:hypothetical protein Tco_0519759 [Tanacetum coccineum]